MSPFHSQLNENVCYHQRKQNIHSFITKCEFPQFNFALKSSRFLSVTHCTVVICRILQLFIKISELEQCRLDDPIRVNLVANL